MARLLDKKFKYRNSEETRSPGYLARRMAKYREQVKREAEKPTADVITPGQWLAKQGAKS